MISYKRTAVTSRYLSIVCIHAYTHTHTSMHIFISCTSHNRICGLDTELLSPRECYEKCPIIRYDDLEVSSKHVVLTSLVFYNVIKLCNRSFVYNLLARGKRHLLPVS